ncbi:MAG: glycerophosphodiester phosphodiesterase family protein [Coxiellaceae bacterium]|nr:glycerophosphodiester phosphodiesterase family protein [Coxiellaceae bacterium]
MTWHLPFAIAHRGASQLAPENTLAALSLAKKKGAIAVECDIQLTKDNVPVILHDATLNRTTNGSGLLSQTAYKKIETLSAGEWFSKKFVKEKIPTLQEWLETASTLDLLLNLEIKARTEKQAVILAKVVCDHIEKFYAKKLPLPLISSSNLFVLKNIFKTNKKLAQGYLIEKKVTRDFMQQCKKINIVAINQPYALFNAHYVQEIHTHQLKTLAYTVNDKNLANELKKIGVDGIFTDNYQLLRERAC